jgi:hypothetical protein
MVVQSIMPHRRRKMQRSAHLKQKTSLHHQTARHDTGCNPRQRPLARHPRSLTRHCASRYPVRLQLRCIEIEVDRERW